MIAEIKIRNKKLKYSSQHNRHKRKLLKNDIHINILKKWNKQIQKELKRP